MRNLALAAAGLLLGLGGCTKSVPNFTPPVVPVRGECTTTDVSGPLVDAGIALCAGPTPAAKCSCTGFSGFPPGVIAREQTSVGAPEACQKGKRLAFPGCGPTATAWGTGFFMDDSNAGKDGDLVFDLCPDSHAASMQVIFDPATPRLQPRELRDRQNFEELPLGRIHIEVQSCRYCRGGYEFPEQPGVLHDTAILEGDRVAASGTWIVDAPQHEGWVEIHEATFIGVVRTLPATAERPANALSYILVNAFFVDAPDQRDDLLLDVRVPSPADAGAPGLPTLLCEVDPPLRTRGCPCQPLPGVTATATPLPDGVCRLRVHRGSGAPAPLSFNCVNTPPCNGGPFTPSPEACANIFYAGAIRARWTQ